MYYTLSDFAQASANCQSNTMPLNGKKGWRFHCPACHWTQSKDYKKNKLTAYLVYSEYQKKWFAKCFRCSDLEMSLTKFIKTHTPYFKHYQNFLFESLGHIFLNVRCPKFHSKTGLCNETSMWRRQLPVEPKTPIRLRP